MDWTLKTLEDNFASNTPWKGVSLLKRATHMIPPVLDSNGVLCACPQSKVAAFAATFERNFVRGREPLPEWAGPSPSTCLVTPADVFELTKKIPLGKSAGANGWPTDVLRALNGPLASAWARLINQIATTRQVPEQWRLARMVPVRKAGDNTAASGWRPISLLPVESRVFEAWLRLQLEPFLATSTSQYAFKKRAGCVDALSALIQAIATASPRGSATCVAVVSLDAAKAYDQVSHLAILEELESRDCPPYLLQILSSWLSGRKFAVNVEDCWSEWVSAASGVPQGSILSPQLFAVAMDKVLRGSFPAGVSVSAYADDITVCGYVGSVDTAARLQETLDLVEARLAGIGLRINPDKSKVLVVDWRGQASPARTRPFSSSGQALEFAARIRVLGLVLDERLTLDHHWRTQSRDIRALAAQVMRLTGGHQRSVRLLLESVVGGRLRFHLAAAPPTSESSWRRLESAMGWMARLATNDFQRRVDSHAYRRSGVELLVELGWDPPRLMAAKLGLRLIYDGIFGERAVGGCLRLALPPPPRQRPTRAVALPPPFTTATLALDEVNSAQESFGRLGIFRFRDQWNRLGLQLPVDQPDGPLSSRAAFSRFLDTPGVLAAIVP